VLKKMCLSSAESRPETKHTFCMQGFLIPEQKGAEHYF